MWASATSTVSCQGDDGAGTDMGALGNEGLREVAIADGEVAVTEGDIKTRTFVSAYLDDFAVHHGVCRFVVCLQIKSVVCGFSFNEWVSAIAERAGDRYVTEWTDKCQEAVGLLRLGLYLGKGKRVSPLMRRARGLLLGCCGLRRFWHSLAVCVGLRDGVELGEYCR